MWLPDWLYKLSPYLYLIFGMVAINHLETITGFASGLLLNFAAGTVLMMRYGYRKTICKAQQRTTRRTFT
jgi:hypothetical protein